MDDLKAKAELHFEGVVQDLNCFMKKLKFLVWTCICLRKNVAEYKNNVEV
jgi:hypothetical protein